MTHDNFLEYLYSRSPLSEATKQTYQRITTKMCAWTGRPHVLDNTLSDLDRYRLYLLKERHYSPASDTLIYNALRHTYCVLLPQVDTEAAVRYRALLTERPRQQYRLPSAVSTSDMRRFIDALPLTACGHILREMYRTSRPFAACANGWKCSKSYAQAICARVARSVGLPQGFGLSGIRAASILHRLGARTSDAEIPEIMEACGLSPSQCLRYLHAAGVRS